ncbi:MAG TPA: helix-turn-helix domain-containing protein [candidate division Zixibacteria bacterium]|uniref:Transcription regulator TrmB N-terminal domain-containing protein n=1 Tax=Candidatus Doudnabacteria bacterium RIFCSPHIGHO2_01_52_17 TaxID=1817820 RepID=A0A1F5NAY5_9BACT|nr:MAG: Transcriptional regulator, TrmB [Parcubacteria group bacterium GW2011_GWA2_52_8]OGE74837.1 MAG: hypothetical protein A3K06_02505 [Candidatus Doudnabacteria bacterium RIFCSPHIGHO2_01_52_17]HLG94356.1 helix-turn-helix domain-containing protein [candidate division Zixibacteria bacterium]
MELSQVLENAGLAEKEAKVYLALLSLGTASVYSVALKAGIKRATTYLVLDSLRQRGLVSVVPHVRKTQYSASNPEVLLDDLRAKEEMVAQYLPSLKSILLAPKEEPQVRLYQGEEGIKDIYQEIYESDGVDFFGTVKGTFPFGPEGIKQFVREISARQIPVRDLLTKSKENQMFAQELRHVSNYQIRFAREGKGFSTDSALFGDKVAFFSFAPQIFVAVIKSSQIVTSVRSLYELAWESAQPLPKG